MALHKVNKQLCASCVRNTYCLGGLLVSDPTPNREMSPQFTQSVLDHGQHLYRIGGLADSLYAIRGGAFKTYTLTDTGEEDIRSFHFADQMIGLDGIFNTRFKSNARAIARSWVCRVPIAAIRSQMLISPSYREAVMSTLAKAFDQLHNLLHMQRCKAERRVADFLRLQLEEQQIPGPLIDLPMSREDLANYLDMAYETVSRVFSRLEVRNIIRYNGQSIDVIDRRALYEIAEVSFQAFDAARSAVSTTPPHYAGGRLVRTSKVPSVRLCP